MAVWCEIYGGHKMREMVYSQNLKIGNLEMDGILMLNWFIKNVECECRHESTVLEEDLIEDTWVYFPPCIQHKILLPRTKR